MQSNGSFHLKIIYAENGHIYKIPVNPSVSIESIKLSLKSTTKLEPNEQILLAERTLTGKTLEYYGITSDKDIYLYNRKILDNQNLKPEEYDLSINEFKKIPKKPAPNNFKLYEDSNDPLHRLYALEYHLCNQLIAIKYIKDELTNKIASVNNLPNDISRQKSAVNVANNSFFEYRDNLSKQSNIFFKDFEKKKPYFDSIFSTFENDISRIKQIKLHESLRTNNRVTLGDCISENDFRKWNKQCRDEYEILKSKLGELESKLNSSYSNSELELNKQIPINDHELQAKLQELHQNLKKVNTLYESFSANYDKLKSTLDQFRNTTDIKTVQEYLQIFLNLRDSQDKTFKNLQFIFDPAIFILKKKGEMNSIVYSQLRSVSRYQEGLRESKSQLAILSEAVFNKFAVNLIQLEVIHKIPQLYEESINEIGRRKKFGSNISNSFNKFLESLKIIRDDENQKRQLFCEQYLQQYMVPIQQFNSLKELLPEFQIQLPPFDQNLPNLNGININQQQQQQQQQQNNNSGGGLTIGGFGTGSNGSSSNGSSNEFDDGFTVIDNLSENIKNTTITNNNVNTTNTNTNNNNNLLNNSNINNSYNNNNNFSTTNQLNNKKLLNELEKSQYEKSQLEQKLQTTFLMASKTEEKYKDLLEKSKQFSQSSLEKQQQQLSIESIKIEELKRELNQKTTEISILTEELAKASGDKLSNQTSIFSLQDDKNQLQSQIDDFKSKIESYEQKVLNLAKEFEEKDVEIKSQHNGDIQSKLKEIEQNKSEIEVLGNTVLELKDSILNLQFENETLKKEKQSIEIESQELRLRQEELQLKLDESQNKNESLQIELVKLKEKSEEIEKLNSSLKEQLDGSQDANERLEQSNQQLQLTIDQLKQTNMINESNQETLNQLNKELKESSEKLKEDFEKLQSVNKALELNNQRLKSTINDFESNTGDLYSATEKLRQKIETLEISNQSLQDQQKQLESENEQLQELNVQYQKELVIHKEQVKSSELILHEQMEEFDKLNVNCNRLELDLKHLQQSKQSIEDELDNLKTTLHQTNQQTNKSNKTYEEEIKQLNNSLQSSKEREADLTNQLDSQQNEISQLENELKLKETQSNSEVKDIHSYYESEVGKLYVQIQTFERALAELSDRNAEQINEIELLKEVRSQNEATHKQELEELRSREITLETKLQENTNQSKDFKKQLQEKDKLLQEKDKLLQQKDQKLQETSASYSELQTRLSDVNGRLNSNNNVQQELNSYKNVIFELSRLIDPDSREPLPLETISQKVSRVIYENVSSNQALVEMTHNLENQISIERSQSALLSNFTHDRLVVFYPNKNKIYEAININTPNYFLSQDSHPSFSEEMKSNLPIVGTVISIEAKIASNPNNFHVHAGTEFFEVTVTKIN